MEQRTITIHYLFGDVGSALCATEDRGFTFDKVPCTSIQSVIAAFTFWGITEQQKVCQMSGLGVMTLPRRSPYPWKQEQKLYWNGKFFDRNSEAYQQLLTSLHDAVYLQDPSFRSSLLALRFHAIESFRGHDPRETPFTKLEEEVQLNRLRIRAHHEEYKPDHLRPV